MNRALTCLFTLYLSGKPAFQPSWEILYRVSLAGINYGRGTFTSESAKHQDGY